MMMNDNFPSTGENSIFNKQTIDEFITNHRETTIMLNAESSKLLKVFTDYYKKYYGDISNWSIVVSKATTNYGLFYLTIIHIKSLSFARVQQGFIKQTLIDLLAVKDFKLCFSMADYTFHGGVSVSLIIHNSTFQNSCRDFLTEEQHGITQQRSDYVSENCNYCKYIKNVMDTTKQPIMDDLKVTIDNETNDKNIRISLGNILNLTPSILAICSYLRLNGAATNAIKARYIQNRDIPITLFFFDKKGIDQYISALKAKGGKSYDDNILYASMW